MKKHTSNLPIGTTFRVKEAPLEFLNKYNVVFRRGYLCTSSGHGFSKKMFSVEYIINKLPEDNKTNIEQIPTIVGEILYSESKESIGIEHHVPEELIEETGRIIDINKFPHEGRNIIAELGTREAGIHISNRNRKNSIIGNTPIKFLKQLRKYVPSTEIVNKEGLEKNTIAAYIEALLMCSYKPKIRIKGNGLLITNGIKLICPSCGTSYTLIKIAQSIEKQRVMNLKKGDPPLSFNCHGCNRTIVLQKTEKTFWAKLKLLNTDTNMHIQQDVHNAEINHIVDEDYFWGHTDVLV